MLNKQLLVMLTSLMLVTACGQKAAEEPSPEPSPEPIAEPVADSGGMVLPATTSSDEARDHYMAGWADFENSRGNTAHDEFSAAAAADSSFAMAHLMAALTGSSTESFVSNLENASANAAGATKGEQLLIRAFEQALASDQAGQIATGQELTALHPDSPRAWVFLGNFHGNVNNSSDARAAYGKAIELDPDLVPARINLGNNLMTQEPKDLGLAEEQFMKAAAITPNEPNPVDLLGDLHRSQGNLEAAYADYTKAAELAPELGSGLQQRGHVNSFLGNFDEARADYSRSAELETARGSNAGGFFLVFRAYASLHEGDFDAAISELREIAQSADSMEMDGKLDLKINALTSAAQAATHSGNNEAASEIVAEVATLMRQQAEEVGTDQFRDATEATICFMEGMLAARMGDTEGAAAKAIEFEGYAASATSPRKLERMHEILGMSAYHQGDFAAAAEHLAKGDYQNNMETKYYLALAHEGAGNAEEYQRLIGELAVWNFNGPGYAMTRGDILARASAE
jgi:Flp pilus assembly protein TadD